MVHEFLSYSAKKKISSFLIHFNNHVSNCMINEICLFNEIYTVEPTLW